MNLATVVAWAAIIGACTSVITVLAGRRAANEAHREARAREVQEAYERGKASMLDLLEQCRKDRDYWRDRFVGRLEHDG